jgi:hypothetical protein
VTIEAEVFIKGKWSNFEELEDTLTMQELVALAKAIFDNKHGDRKFAAALNGIDLESEVNEYGTEGEGEMVDIFKHPVADKLRQEKYGNDILTLQGGAAEEAGFGIGQGLGYESI